MNQPRRTITHFRVPPDLHETLRIFIRNVTAPPPHWPLGSAIDLYQDLQRCEAVLTPLPNPQTPEPKGHIVDVDPPANDPACDELNPAEGNDEIPPPKLANTTEESKNA